MKYFYKTYFTNIIFSFILLPLFLLVFLLFSLIDFVYISNYIKDAKKIIYYVLVIILKTSIGKILTKYDIEVNNLFNAIKEFENKYDH